MRNHCSGTKHKAANWATIRGNYSKNSRTIRRNYASSAIFLSILLKKNNNLGPIVDIFINSHPCEPKRSKFIWSWTSIGSPWRTSLYSSGNWSYIKEGLSVPFSFYLPLLDLAAKGRTRYWYLEQNNSIFDGLNHSFSSFWFVFIVHMSSHSKGSGPRHRPRQPVPWWLRSVLGLDLQASTICTCSSWSGRSGGSVGVVLPSNPGLMLHGK